MNGAANFEGRRALVLGLGETGVSMAGWLARRGARVEAADTRADPPGLRALTALLPAAAVRLGAFTGELFAGVDLVAISPGVPRSQAEVARAAARGVPVLGDIELFAQELSAASGAAQRAPRVLAITGTNGKSTVTALCGELCRAAGMDAEVAGNIGPAVLDAWERRRAGGRMPQVWVLELSSFQLESTFSLAPDAATVLNLSDDHLDRYAGIEEYAAAKARIFDRGGVQVLNRDDPRSLAMARAERVARSFGLDAPPEPEDFGVLEFSGDAWLVQGETPVLAARELAIAGWHNAANALAALALARSLALPLAPMLPALRGFRGLPHRVELVGSQAGVRYYDDSKGTNVGATVAAIEGFARGGGKVVLIAGGDGKGQDFAPLAAPIERSVRCLVLIGRDAPLIEHAVAGRSVAVVRVADMPHAVQAAARAARAGDAVLLSPACASFDMFRDYRERGDAFRAAVEGLEHARLA